MPDLRVLFNFLMFVFSATFLGIYPARSAEVIACVYTSSLLPLTSGLMFSVDQ